MALTRRGFWLALLLGIGGLGGPVWGAEPALDWARSWVARARESGPEGALALAEAWRQAELAAGWEAPGAWGPWDLPWLWGAAAAASLALGAALVLRGRGRVAAAGVFAAALLALAGLALAPPAPGALVTEAFWPREGDGLYEARVGFDVWHPGQPVKIEEVRSGWARVTTARREGWLPLRVLDQGGFGPPASGP